MTRSNSAPAVVTRSDSDVDADRLLTLYNAMLLPRVIEERGLNLLRQGRVGKWFSAMGQEAISAGIICTARPDDVIFTAHRNMGVFAGRVDLARMFRQLFGKDGGFTKGRERTFHFGAPENGVIGMISHLCAMLPVAAGRSLAEKLSGTDRIVFVTCGDGASAEGDFHEAVNLAAVWKLPVVFIIENNQYSLSTPASEQYITSTLANRAIGYGIPGIVADGNDIVEVSRVLGEAAERARRGDGPSLVELKTFRVRGHEEASGVKYVPPELIEEWKTKDPLVRMETLLIERGIMTKTGLAELKRPIKEHVDSLAEEALKIPEPDSTAEREMADVYAPSKYSPVSEDVPADRPASDMRYVDAVRDGLAEAMRRNPRVVLMGQDIAEYGGVFKATDGLVQEFGKDRVRNTPTIESGMVGAGVGLALGGYVPMMEIQYGDFITCAFNQIVNNVAKTHYRWGSAIPMVIRAPIGGGLAAGTFHSQNVEAWFTHVAGLKVVQPATSRDAKGLLLAAFEDGNPVLYLEHKFLYRSEKGKVPAGHYSIPIGEARVAREGQHATLVTYGVGVPWALEAAAELAREGHELEVIDLRSLLPWDVERVVRSVAKTGRCLVLHEAPLTGGFAGEIAATVGREAFEYLDAPVVRLGALDTPVPFAKALEALYSPKARLLPALRELISY